MSKLEDLFWPLLESYGAQRQVSLSKVAEQLGDSSPYTRLTVDYWLPRLRIAVEVQGEQHFKPGFGKTKLEHKRQVRNDEVKALELRRLGVELLYVYLKDTPTELLKRLRELEHRRKEWVVDVGNEPSRNGPQRLKGNRLRSRPFSGRSRKLGRR
jgi:very-short-patch-repair endonuclease